MSCLGIIIKSGSSIMVSKPIKNQLYASKVCNDLWQGSLASIQLVYKSLHLKSPCQTTISIYSKTGSFVNRLFCLLFLFTQSHNVLHITSYSTARATFRIGFPRFPYIPALFTALHVI